MDYAITERLGPPSDGGYFYPPTGEPVAVERVRLVSNPPAHHLILWSEHHSDAGTFVVSTPKLLRWVALIDETLASPVETMSIHAGPVGITCQLGFQFAKRIRTAIVEYCALHGLQ